MLSCASLLLAKGVPLKHIQEWLGHSDFTTTANIYAHLDYKSKITSAQAMETGLALPEGGDFGSRWGSIDVGENGCFFLRKSERARNCPFRKKERACNRLDYRLLMAQRVGFEPTVLLPVHLISSQNSLFRNRRN